MKSWSIALILAFSLAAVAQDVTPARNKSHGKTVNLSGTMSDDGRVLLRDSNGKIWTVSNPEMLHDYNGQEVVIRGRLTTESHELTVVSVKPMKKEYVANWGDSAFRR